jgi:hypothetical protein
MAERCLRNIGRLVRPYGYLVVSGVDLDVRTKVAEDLGWRPVQELLEQLKKGRDWKRRHVAVFQMLSCDKKASSTVGLAVSLELAAATDPSLQ